MVLNLQVDRTANRVADTLGDEGLVSAAVAGVSGAGGLFVADWVANRVLPMVGFSASPDSMVELLASLGVKVGTAAGVALVAARLDGMPQAAAAIVALGVLASAGIDVIDTFFGFPELAGPTGGTAIAASSGSPTVTKASTGSSRRRVTADGGSAGGSRPSIRRR